MYMVCTRPALESNILHDVCHDGSDEEVTAPLVLELTG